MSRIRLWIPALAALALAPAAGAAIGWLQPQADYVADTRMQSDSGALEGRVWVSRDKERRELTVKGRRHVVILRRDRGVTWVLLPEQRMYLETTADEIGLELDRFAQGSLEREAQGTEPVNGTATTRYRVHGATSDGEPFEGTMWMTDQDIPMRVLSGEGALQVRMELRNLRVGPVDPARFEIPAGYQRFELPPPAKAELDALRRCDAR